ncbi:MAG: pectinesterase family protein [Sediminibacterium sp.]|nr:pectinesterase family protein [Sediminibacterium sp.]
MNICSIPKENKIIVSKDSNAHFHSIQDAINSIYNDHILTIIYIKNGVYDEKIFIKKNNIHFISQSLEKTIIQQAISREIWRCNNESDWGGATINVDSCSNLTFENITVKNNYGLENTKTINGYCLLDSNKPKKFTPYAHQMAFRSFNATKLKFKKCNFISAGGDTMSPWNLENGMFYFDNCYFEGMVDLFCPRGNSFAINCTFNAIGGSAILWHDGSNNESFKTVIYKCNFKGIDSFNLGRYHKESQFYLINCNFANNMANKDIYKVLTNNFFNWGRRVYFFNCNKRGQQFDFYKNNITYSAKKLKSTILNPYWVFNQQWHPN